MRRIEVQTTISAPAASEPAFSRRADYHLSVAEEAAEPGLPLHVRSRQAEQTVGDNGGMSESKNPSSNAAAGRVGGLTAWATDRAAPWRGYCTPLDYPCLGVTGHQQAVAGTPGEAGCGGPPGLCAWTRWVSTGSVVAVGAYAGV